MMKMKWKTLLVMCASLATVHCAHKDVRQPAGTKDLLTNDEARAFSELLGDDSPLNPVRHPLKIQLRTSGDGKYLSETAEKALREAIMKSLQGDAPEQGLAKAVGSNLKGALIDNFIKTLRFYKIINVGIQVDLTFLPEPHNYQDFASELSSNQLVRLNEVGKLSEKWKKEDKPLTNKLFTNSFYIPTTNSPKNYVGGLFTLYVKILDADPKLKTPNIAKNGVKGFVRYRRIYRMNEVPQKNLICENFVSTFKALGERVPLFYTLDLYKKFNLAEISPEEETIEIYPGLIAAQGEGRDGLMPDSSVRSEDTGKAGSSISTGIFSVQQKGSSKKDANIKISKIVYNLSDRKISSARSKIGNGISEKSGKDLSAYFEKCESNIKTFFNLDSVIPGGTL